MAQPPVTIAISCVLACPQSLWRSGATPAFLHTTGAALFEASQSHKSPLIIKRVAPLLKISGASKKWLSNALNRLGGPTAPLLFIHPPNATQNAPRPCLQLHARIPYARRAAGLTRKRNPGSHVLLKYPCGLKWTQKDKILAGGAAACRPTIICAMLSYRVIHTLVRYGLRAASCSSSHHPS